MYHKTHIFVIYSIIGSSYIGIRSFALLAYYISYPTLLKFSMCDCMGLYITLFKFAIQMYVIDFLSMNFMAITLKRQIVEVCIGLYFANMEFRTKIKFI